MARAQRILVSIASLLLATTSQSQSQNSQIDSLVDSLRQVRSPINAIISPDGRKLAWTVGSELHLTNLTTDGAPEPNTADRLISPDTIADPANHLPGQCPTSHPAWSPDGTRLAFLARCFGTDGRWQPNTQDDLYVLTFATNTLQQVSHLHGAVSSIQWSPDGKTIAFLYVENATRRAGALDAMKPWSGVIGEDGVEVQRVALVSLQQSPNPSADVMNISPQNLHAFEFSWAPDSNSIVYVAANLPGENNWWKAQLFTQVIWPGCWPNQPQGSGCAVPYVVLSPAHIGGTLHNLQIALPRYSPDGKSIAFIGGLMSDQGAIGGDIYLIPATGVGGLTLPTDLTPNRPASPAYIEWLDDHDIGISEHIGGNTRITTLDTRTGKDVPGLAVTLPETISAGTDAMSVSVAAHSSNVALIRESFAHPPEVYAGPIDSLHQISHLNDNLHPAWGHAEPIDYTNAGFHLQGWLIYPAGWTPNSNSATKYPLIVGVHGGPSSAVTPRWPTASYGSVPFSALGYFVFLPNPRGSFGQGEKFTEANVRDFGYGDLSDILAGVDAVEKRFPIETHREGITGWSYGGFMTMFAVTQTTRFRAAVAGAGIANWQSYYGENSIDQWMLPFFGASVYDDPAIYAKSSPINFIKQAHTPTLVVVGDRDGECPAPQSFEFWHALRDLNVKTQLVIYPNEGHHFSDPAHQTDVLKRALDWFQTEMR